MNSEEFTKEVLQNSIYKENFPQIYEEFQFFQDMAIETLKEFHRVCEKNKINYQLAFGSLLGAVRDNGQIPWDYDVDVLVPSIEKKRLINALEKDLDEKFYFFCPEKNKRCRHLIMRLAPKGFRSEVLHVDVFYLAGVSDDLEIRQSEIRTIKKISEKRYYRLVKFLDENSTIKWFIKKMIGKLACVGYNTDKMYHKYESLCLKYDLNNVKYSICADACAESYLFSNNIMKETTLIQNKYGTFRIPVYYDQILTLLYGDYKKIPSLEFRINEMMNSYKKLHRYATK